MVTQKNKTKIVALRANKKHNAKVHFKKVSRVEENVKAFSEENDDEQEYRISAKKHVIIDVGGERFQAEKERFLKFPNTRLGTKYIWDPVIYSIDWDFIYLL